MSQTGVFQDKTGWRATITNTDGSILDIGTFPDRASARDAYIKKSAELYPVPPSQPVDPKKVHAFTADNLTVAKPNVGPSAKK